MWRVRTSCVSHVRFDDGPGGCQPDNPEVPQLQHSRQDGKAVLLGGYCPRSGSMRRRLQGRQGVGLCTQLKACRKQCCNVRITLMETRGSIDLVRCRGALEMLIKDSVLTRPSDF